LTKKKATIDRTGFTDEIVQWGMDSASLPVAGEILCREIDDPSDPVLPSARALYESVLDESERIPWEWLARTPERRRAWRPGERRGHLVVATPRAADDRAIGFGYGAFIPGYGGYVCYLGVDPIARGRGIGTMLFELLFQLIAGAARTSGMSLPFILWESHRPDDSRLWAARIRLFDRVGGKWARGITLLTPNYMQDDSPPVSLQVFLRTQDNPPDSFDGERLRDAIRGLYANVYRITPDDPLFEATLNGAVNPELVPTVNALR
jgi:GNAT superfamily N-acetyltransferase